MQEEHRRAITTNFSTLVERTDLDLIVSALYEKGVFSEQMIEPYKTAHVPARDRKRLMYRDIMRRGPNAFGLLIEALTETGHWDVVRCLDPDNVLHRRAPLGSTASGSGSGSGFVSLRRPPEIRNNEVERRGEESQPQKEELDEEDKEIPCFHVVKSTKFVESTDVDYPLYPTRGKRRGLMYAFTCMKFRYSIDKDRKGAIVDHKNLLYLFQELGLTSFGYTNLEKRELMDTMRGLRAVDGMKDVECIFIVVSSHGYQSHNWYDTELRCSDGELVGILHIIEMFNNINFPELKGVPKVFIFQTCRGDKEAFGSWGVARDNIAGNVPKLTKNHTPKNKRSKRKPRKWLKMCLCYSSGDNEDVGSWGVERDGTVAGGGEPYRSSPMAEGGGEPYLSSPMAGGGGEPYLSSPMAGGGEPHLSSPLAGDGGEPHLSPPLAGNGGNDTDLTQRPYSDILIAHSTIPGHVSHRDTKKGSWFVQSLCEVFAERAHDSHVENLFHLVDNKLQKYGPQTSSIEKWGFSKRLYLHPGLTVEKLGAHSE